MSHEYLNTSLKMKRALHESKESSTKKASVEKTSIKKASSKEASMKKASGKEASTKKASIVSEIVSTPPMPDSATLSEISVVQEDEGANKNVNEILNESHAKSEIVVKDNESVSAASTSTEAAVRLASKNANLPPPQVDHNSMSSSNVTDATQSLVE